MTLPTFLLPPPIPDPEEGATFRVGDSRTTHNDARQGGGSVWAFRVEQEMDVYARSPYGAKLALLRDLWNPDWKEEGRRVFQDFWDGVFTGGQGEGAQQ